MAKNEKKAAGKFEGADPSGGEDASKANNTWLYALGAVAAVAGAGARITEHDGPQFGLLEPLGNAAAQDATLRFSKSSGEMITLSVNVALAGDDQHCLQGARLRGTQEGVQLRAGIALAHAVQVEARVDRDLAGGDLADSAAIEIDKGRRPG